MLSLIFDRKNVAKATKRGDQNISHVAMVSKWKMFGGYFPSSNYQVSKVPTHISPQNINIVHALLTLHHQQKRFVRLLWLHNNFHFAWKIIYKIGFVKRNQILRSCRSHIFGKVSVWKQIFPNVACWCCKFSFFCTPRKMYILRPNMVLKRNQTYFSEEISWTFLAKSPISKEKFWQKWCSLVKIDSHKWTFSEHQSRKKTEVFGRFCFGPWQSLERRYVAVSHKRRTKHIEKAENYKGSSIAQVQKKRKKSCYKAQTAEAKDARHGGNSK